MDNATTHRIIVETLKELGISNPKFSVANTRVLVRNGFYVGRRLLCGHIQVVLLASREKIEFYNQDGNLLKAVALAQSVPEQGVAA
jgi:hypothetical protein